MGIEFVPYRPELAQAVARLQTHLWSGSTERNERYFRWKYLENPYVREPIVRVGMDGPRAVAMRGAFGSAWEAGGSREPVVIPCVDDMVVDPEYRNRGLVRPLMDALLEDLEARGFRYLLSLSASPITLVVSLASGWRTVGSTEPLVRVSRGAARARRWRGRFGRVPVLGRLTRGTPAIDREPFGRLDRSRRRQRRITMVREARSEEMARLIQRVGSDGRIRHVRDAGYFDWRFRNPLAEYRFFYWDERALDGFLVLRRNASDRGVATGVKIVESEATNPTVRAALLDEALHRGRFARVATWGVTLPEPVRSQLHARDFRAPDRTTVARAEHRILVHCLDPSAEDWKLNNRSLLDIRQWDLHPVQSMAG